MKIDVIRRSEWADTKFTLHLISQILGKIKLETAQQEPQWAHVALTVTPSGFSTGLLFSGNSVFQIDLDIPGSRILVNVNGNLQSVTLETGKSIKDYFEEIFRSLTSRSIGLAINPKPQEMTYKKNLDEDAAPLTFNQQHAMQGLKLFQLALREEMKFIGPLRCRKMKPALFWGTFDVSALIVRNIPEPFPEDKIIEKAAFDEQMIEYGFWLGDENVEIPSFFVLPYPFIYKDLNAPSLQPSHAYYDPALSEFFLDLESVSALENPDMAIQSFFRSTFDLLIQQLGWKGCDYFFTPLTMRKQRNRDSAN